ncbi:B3 domain-containing transcription repressor VAL1-like isoform X2 [Rhodamnia argentea]|uniref:B3 domain-containing transcription repressor VAL1-like isoform X2 n=1 Tax=Rhodamnia argentea TaxID=178133 RepID=A0ABM3HH20_9MYRT|nr:B3 domain-containing transcription repressor VAL1-like isoform X2 [Rhodamnia argentea]
MGSMICMNESCGTPCPDWTKGWPLRSGGLAHLCLQCGSAYENSLYCDLFHQEESGWRECRFCAKRLHCGCIASSSLVEFVDYGGVMCISCSKNQTHPPTSTEDRGTDEEKLMQLYKFMSNEPKVLLQAPRDDIRASYGEVQQETRPFSGEAAIDLSHGTDPTVGSHKLTKLEDGKFLLKLKDTHRSLPHPSLNISLGSPGVSSHIVSPFSGGVGEGSQTVGPSSLHQVPRPPAEGRGKNQLLPRYWPRITDQELQQLSGDLNSTIIPLFEKVLSASDAGRIGRLVLPKACAEAYFPPISQSEGIPVRIQDVKGNEWTFQFRFWPNNNSRMYVLEGVTPCIQSMQLRAGDTVIFSRIDPGGKLIMGFRKASHSSDLQENQVSIVPNGDVSRGGSFQTFMGSLPIVDDYSNLFRTSNGIKDPRLNPSSELLSNNDADTCCDKTEDDVGRTCQDPAKQALPVPEKKRTRNIGSKSRRMLIHNEDVLELRLTWEEAQDLLRPPPCVKPSTVTVEGHVFEEYDEPPVFGKRTIFVSQLSGGPEQWAQCDDCSKWRKLPMDVHLPSRWTCSDNVWDSRRRICSAPDEMSPEELESLLRVNKDVKRQRVDEDHREDSDGETSGLDALASAAVLGESIDDPGEPSSGVTTKHPRHRPGCTCIVCIQPPSGKGKHKPTCTCNVCMTVKRRFKTLMLRKKKCQSDWEAENMHKDLIHHGHELGTDGTLANASSEINHGENVTSQMKKTEVADSSNGHIDLNCHPDHENVQPDGEIRSITGFTQETKYLSANDSTHGVIPTLQCEHLASTSSSLFGRTVEEKEKRLYNGECLPSISYETNDAGDEG